MFLKNSWYVAAWDREIESKPLGRTILPLDDALRFIASEDIFWAAR